MLIEFKKFLDSHRPKMIIGFNLQFDLSALRLAYAREGIRVPVALGPQTKYIDVMRLFIRYYHSNGYREPYISLSRVLHYLGLNTKSGSGEKAPKLFELGKSGEIDNVHHVELANYNIMDTLLVLEAYNRLNLSSFNQYPMFKFGDI